MRCGELSITHKHYFLINIILLVIKSNGDLTSDCNSLTSAHLMFEGRCLVTTTPILNEYTTAAVNCTELPNGHLAFIRSRQQIDALDSAGLLGTNGTAYHVGLRQVNKTQALEPNKNWFYVDGSDHIYGAVPMSNIWLPNEPDNYNVDGFEDYGQLTNRPSWDATDVGLDDGTNWGGTIGYICEYEPIPLNESYLLGVVPPEETVTPKNGTNRHQSILLLVLFCFFCLEMKIVLV